MHTSGILLYMLNVDKSKIEESVKEAGRNVWKRMLTYIGAGFGLVIGLAWNDAIALLIKTIFPESTGTLIAKFVYAFLLTLIVGFTLYYVEKIVNKTSNEEKK
jgi:tetrahydromethanopterin S-methyltransferase subunit G